MPRRKNTELTRPQIAMQNIMDFWAQVNDIQYYRQWQLISRKMKGSGPVDAYCRYNLAQNLYATEMTDPFQQVFGPLPPVVNVGGFWTYYSEEHYSFAILEAGPQTNPVATVGFSYPLEGGGYGCDGVREGALTVGIAFPGIGQSIKVKTRCVAAQYRPGPHSYWWLPYNPLDSLTAAHKLLLTNHLLALR
jgi:hypothetical protein